MRRTRRFAVAGRERQPVMRLISGKRYEDDDLDRPADQAQARNGSSGAIGRRLPRPADTRAMPRFAPRRRPARQPAAQAEGRLEGRLEVVRGSAPRVGEQIAASAAPGQPRERPPTRKACAAGCAHVARPRPRGYRSVTSRPVRRHLAQSAERRFRSDTSKLRRLRLLMPTRQRREAQARDRVPAVVHLDQHRHAERPAPAPQVGHLRIVGQATMSRCNRRPSRAPRTPGRSIRTLRSTGSVQTAPAAWVRRRAWKNARSVPTRSGRPPPLVGRGDLDQDGMFQHAPYSGSPS